MNVNVIEELGQQQSQVFEKVTGKSKTCLKFLVSFQGHINADNDVSGEDDDDNEQLVDDDAADEDDSAEVLPTLMDEPDDDDEDDGPHYHGSFLGILHEILINKSPVGHTNGVIDALFGCYGLMQRFDRLPGHTCEDIDSLSGFVNRVIRLPGRMTHEDIEDLYGLLIRVNSLPV